MSEGPAGEPGARTPGPAPTYVNYPLDARSPTEPPYDGGAPVVYDTGYVTVHLSNEPPPNDSARALADAQALPLAAPPRAVPRAVYVGLAAFSFWELFAILMTVVSPMAIWIFIPGLIPIAFLGVAVLGALRRVAMFRRRLRLLRVGQVARVSKVEDSYGTSSYQNVPLPQAVGWKVTRASYSGQSHTSKIDFTVDERPGTMTLRGRPYAGGIILADPADPDLALCVSSFPWQMRPGERGELEVRTGPFAIAGIVLTVLVYAGLVVGSGVVVALVWV